MTGRPTPFTESQKRDTVQLVKRVLLRLILIVIIRITSQYSARHNNMATPSKDTEEQVKTSAITNIKYWGGAYLHRNSIHSIRSLMEFSESPVPPTILATLITAQHARPPQFLPLLFPPLLLFSSYLNLNDYKNDSAGFNAAWSGLYLVLARRRKQPLTSKWGPRGIVRGATLGVCLANVVGGGMVYALGKREEEK